MKKKLAILAVLCTILITLGGISTNYIYGTQYMTSKPGYSFSVSSAVTWWDCNWSYCKPITIDHTKVQSTLTNYPVLLRRESDSDLAAYAQDDGDDIVFVDSNNITQYKHEIEEFNGGTGELTAWVQVSSVSSSQDTILWMYYGNPDCSSEQNMTGTWNSNYIMVHHLEESSGTIIDSTSNYNNGTNNGAAANSNSKIDGGYDFDGTDNITVNDGSTLDITSSITLEGWVKDPPWFSKILKETRVEIVNKRDENLSIVPDTSFTVERTVSGAPRSEAVFVALFSQDLNIEDMKINDKSVFEGFYDVGSGTVERIENIRNQLPEELKELEIVAYSKPFIINGEVTVEMQFNIKRFCKLSPDSRISYLVISSDNSYDFESTTHLYPKILGAWFDPFSIIDDLLKFIFGEDKEKTNDSSNDRKLKVVEDKPEEKNGEYKKKVTVSSDSNAAVTTDIPEVRYESQVSLVELLEENDVKVKGYRLLDTNNNGLYDKIEWDVQKSNDKKYEAKIDFNKVKFASETTDIIDNYNGKFNALISSRNKNYYNKSDNKYHPIDVTLVSSSQSDFIYENTKNIISSYYSSDGRVKIDKDGRWAATIPVNQNFGNVKNTKVESNNNVVTYYDYYDNVDLRYTVSSNGVLEEFVVNQSTDISEIREELIFSGVYYQESGDGFAFYDEITNELMFRIPAPVMWEQDVPDERSYGIQYDLSIVDGRYYLSKVITEEGQAWLQDPDRFYPVIIDAYWENTNPAEDGYATYSEGYSTTTDACGLLFGYDEGEKNPSYYRAYVEWDISYLIEASATSIDDVDFEYEGLSRGSGTYNSIKSMEVQPTSNTDQGIYDDCANGTAYVSGSGTFPEVGVGKSIDLGSSADSNLMGAITAEQSWWAIGMVEDNEDVDYSSVGAEECAGVPDYPPTLNVTYSTTPPNNAPTATYLNMETEPGANAGWDFDNNNVTIDWTVDDEDSDILYLCFNYSKGSDTTGNPTNDSCQGKITVTDGGSPGYEANNYDFDWTDTSGWSDYDGTVYIGMRAYDGQEYSDKVTDNQFGGTAGGIDGTNPVFSAWAQDQDSDSGGDDYPPNVGYEDDSTTQGDFSGCSDATSGIATSAYKIKSNEVGTWGSAGAATNRQCTVNLGWNNISYHIEDNAGNILEGDTTDNIFYGTTDPSGMDIDITGNIGGYASGDPSWIADSTDITSGTLYINTGLGDQTWGITMDASGDWGSGGAWFVFFEDGWGGGGQGDAVPPYQAYPSYHSNTGAEANITVDIINQCGEVQQLILTTTEDTTDPTTTFSSITENDPHTYIYYPGSGQTVYFSDEMGDTDQFFTVVVTADNGSGAPIYCVRMSEWDDDPDWNDTSEEYSRQYSTDSSETSGSINLYAYDQVGNYDQSPVVITMAEDTTGPTVTVTGESESSVYLYSDFGTVQQGYYGSNMATGQTYTISGTAEDGGAGLASIEDDTSFGDNPSNSGSVASWSFGYTIDATDNGDVNVTYTATDNVGNTGDDWYQFNEDNQVPVTGLTDISASIYDIDNINGTATDNVSVDWVNISLKNTTTNKYWTGSGWTDSIAWVGATANDSTFDSASEGWNVDVSSISWTVGSSYEVNATSFDVVNNTDWDLDSFTIASINTAPTVDYKTPANQSTNICPNPSVTCQAYVNDTDGNDLDVTWATNESGDWTNVHTNTSVSANTTVSYQFTQFDDHGTKYWWKVFVDDGTENVSEVYYFTTDYKPTQSGEAPTNQSTGISLTPALYVICTDADSDTMTATWRSNSSGSWATFQTNTSITTGTNITQTNSNFSSYSTKYWWSINLTDGCNWTNATYHFTTEESGIIPDPILFFKASTYNTTQINLTWVKGNNSDYTHIRWDTGTYPSSISDGNLTYNNTGTSHSATGLPVNTVIYFRAWSYNSTYSTFSNISSNVSGRTWPNPNASGLIISPDPAYANTNLNLTYNYTGGYQGTTTYVWKVNGGTVDSGNTNTFVNYTYGDYEHIVDGSFNGAISVYAADVDGDGDMDVLGAAYEANDITWWENTNGIGTSWTEHIVDGSFTGVRSVYAEDVDGDGDMDVLGAAYSDDDITWWENTNGIGTSWTEHIVDGTFTGAYDVYAADVDGDGDIDVLGAAYSDDDITWWENTNGIGTSWTEHIVDGSFNGAYEVYAEDIDDDGDMDILGAAYLDNDITWWENTNGNGSSWTEHIVDGTFTGAQSVYAEDVDGDGDMDILGAAYEANDITWWENTNGIGTSWTEHIVDGTFTGARSVYAEDVDGDGDIDVLGAAYSGNDINLWENTNGIGTSWTEHIVDGTFTGAYDVYAADVDGDGDIDVLGAAYSDDDITWWENVQQGYITLSSTNFNSSDTVCCEITPVNIRDETGIMNSECITISNEPPYQKNEVPSSQTTNICPIPQLYVICADNDTGDTMNATWWSNSSGSWLQFASNETSFANNTNITQTNTNFTNAGTTYYWSVNLTDGNGGWNNQTYSFTTNYAPTQTGEYPSNGATGVQANPYLYIIANDQDAGDTLTVYWYSNSSGSWAQFATNSTSPGTNVSQQNTNFSIYGETYYWSANITDGCTWSNQTYSLTIIMPITLSSESPTNGSTGIALNPTLQITANHTYGYNMNITWYWGTTSACPNEIGSNNSISNGTYQQDNDNNFSSNSQTYYWKVVVNDGNGAWLNETYHFTTIGHNKVVVGKTTNAYSLEIHPDGDVLYGYINGNSVSASIDTDWHHIALTYDGSQIRLYKDGVLVDNTSLSGNINTNNENLVLGEYLTGTLDEIRISNSARSTAWINTTYLNTNSPTTFATFGTQRGILTTWTYRKQIWINSSMVDSDLTNFPVLISTTDTDLKNHALSNGYDIMFMATTVDWTSGSYTSKLNHEIEKYDDSTGELVAWINVTSVSSSTNTSIYMYYGNSLCTANRQNPNGVWDSDFIAVWHFSEESGTTTNDSTSNNNHGYFKGSGEPAWTSGKFGNAVDFDGSDDYINVSDSASLDSLTGDITVEGFVYEDTGSGTAGHPLVYKGNGSSAYGVFAFGEYSDDGAFASLNNSNQLLDTDGAIVQGTWQQWVFVHDAGTSLAWYVNGTQDVDTGTAVSPVNTDNNDLQIARWYDFSNATKYFDGKFEELRISKVARNTSWINASYKNVNDTSNFIGFGSQKTRNVAPTQSSPSPADGATGISLNPTLSIQVNDTNIDALNVTFRTNASGSWQNIGYNDSVYNGTYYQTTSNMDQYSKKYWWSVNVTDGVLWSNATYNFTTQANQAPILSNEEPNNESTGISATPICNITVTDAESMTVKFYENTTDSWVLQQTNLSVASGTKVIWNDYNNATDASTKYWWKVCVSDSYTWTNETYYFTTS